MPSSDEKRSRFVVDAMLGSLARKLRILGFDASYYKAGEDSGMLRVATLERRIIITSDRSLASRATARGLTAILVGGKSDGERVSSISRVARDSGIHLVRGSPLCSLCGGNLTALRKREVAGQVPPSVERRHRLFYRCIKCGHLYWRGSHWKKLRLIVRRLEEN